MIKKLLTALLISAITLAPNLSVYNTNPFILTSEAHQGRTDSSGGHHDYKNKSGLGGYHYHCGGNPAHLHTDGVCPYNGSTINHSNSNKAAQTSKPALSIPSNINLVFDATYYADTNSDLKRAYGYDYTSLVNHFVTMGMKEGRVGCSTFNVQVYKDNNPDLQALYGDDLTSYYTHYMNSGYTEGRVAN